MISRRRAVAALLWLGFGWGLSHPLGKIATETGHPPFGLIFWQLVVCVLVLGAIALVRRKPLPLDARSLRFYALVAVLGTLVPNFTFYLSVSRLPAGIMSIIISMVPLISFPIALMVGNDRFAWGRLVGLLLGLAGVALIALPKSSLPDPAMAAFLPLALVGPLFYAMEANYVAWSGRAGADPLSAMLGASLAGMILCLPLTLAFGQWISPLQPWGRPEWALVISSAMHALLYTSYVWLAAAAGAVFAAQSSYLVTASGMVSAMVLLGERFSPLVWVAMAVMLAGVALVQPRPRAAAQLPA